MGAQTESRGLGENGCMVYIEPEIIASDQPIGDTMGDLGARIYHNDERLPLDAIPQIQGNINNTISRLQAQRNMPGADVAWIDHKIALLYEANRSVDEALAGLMTAHGAFSEYLGVTAVKIA